MAYKVGLLFGILGLVSAVILVLGLMIALSGAISLSPELGGQIGGGAFRPLAADPGNTNIGLMTAGISFASMMIGLVGTTSTIILGWRNESRQSAEYRLRIEQLELQLTEAKKKAG